MQIPIMAAIQGLTVLSRILHLDGSASPKAAPAHASAGRSGRSEQAAAKPGGSCIGIRRDAMDFNTAMQVQGLIKTVGDRLTMAERQTVGRLVNEGNAPQAVHMLQQLANQRVPELAGMPLGGGSPFTFTMPAIRPM